MANTAPTPPPARYQRQERDTFFDDACDSPGCDHCVYRNNLRKLLGTLIEALQLTNDSVEHALRMWGECTDQTCTFERTLCGYFSNGYINTVAALTAIFTNVDVWKTLPPTWAVAEHDALTTEMDRADAWQSVAKAHENLRRRSAMRRP